jgi:hypothetical protein
MSRKTNIFTTPQTHRLNLIICQANPQLLANQAIGSNLTPLKSHKKTRPFGK